MENHVSPATDFDLDAFVRTGTGRGLFWHFNLDTRAVHGNIPTIRGANKLYTYLGGQPSIAPVTKELSSQLWSAFLRQYWLYWQMPFYTIEDSASAPRFQLQDYTVYQATIYMGLSLLTRISKISGNSSDWCRCGMP